MNRILVTGAQGQLGSDIIKRLKQQDYIPLGVDIAEMDLTDPAAITTVTTALQPDAIIHCGAYTQVDLAEDQPDLCHQINSEATRILATYASQADIPILYISTDYIFDGTKPTPYTEADTPNPINTYGITKLAGEQHIQALTTKHFIVRISWVFGINGQNFVKTMLRLAQTHPEINIVADQIGAPTYTVDLAKLLLEMLTSTQYGIYHATNEGSCSWYDFAKEIFHQFNLNVKINPITTNQFPTQAKRPQNSRLSQQKLINADFTPLPPWQEALKNWRIEYEQLEKE